MVADPSEESPPSSAIVVNARVIVPSSAVTITATRASGPGGQNVNKVSSKVDVRVDLTAISGFDEPARQRLVTAHASRIDAEGRLFITSKKTRDQHKNIEDAYAKVAALLNEALTVQKPRRPTRPSRAAKARRLSDKRHTAERKKSRGAVDD